MESPRARSCLEEEADQAPQMSKVGLESLRTMQKKKKKEKISCNYKLNTVYEEEKLLVLQRGEGVEDK